MTPEEIKSVLDSHKIWKNKRSGGKRANLYGANLYGADLSGANLSWADLRGADLSGDNLYRANLYRADLSGANLSGANLSWANLYGADLSGANLSGADLRGADLSWANLSWANLYRADLSGANLYQADLSGAKIEFLKLPSIKMLASFDLGQLSDQLTLELMRRDAWAHPKPELFDAWSKGDSCPYQNEDRFWLFELKKELWKPGAPKMRDSDLIIAICKEKGWKVSGYVE
jgi:hypothetical protein